MMTFPGVRRLRRRLPSKGLFHQLPFHFFTQAQLHLAHRYFCFSSANHFWSLWTGTLMENCIPHFWGRYQNTWEWTGTGIPADPSIFLFHFSLLSATNATLPPITYVQRSDSTFSFSSTSSFSSITSITHHNLRSLDREWQSSDSDLPPLGNQLVTVFLVFFCIFSIFSHFLYFFVFYCNFVFL